MKRQPVVDDPEAGFTLTEVLAALLILAIAITGILAAMGSSIVASDFHRKLVTDDAVVRSYAEKLAAGSFVECPTPASAGYSPAGVGLDLSQWPGFEVSIVSVDFWDGSTASSTLNFTNTCVPGSVGAGLQRITLQSRSLTGTSGSQQMTILKRRP